jgi:hypothetical protein
MNMSEREREREREKRETGMQTLRKVRAPWLFSTPASEPLTTKGTSGDATNFC